MTLQESLNNDNKHQLYNDEPVFYCKRCLSLKIMSVPGVEDSDFCDSCNSNDIDQISIEEWERLYINRYHHRFLETY